MKTCIAVALALMAFTGLFHAQHALDGTWEGETRNGSTVILTLAVKGTVLTGTLARDEHSSPLTDGTVTEERFSFKATLNDQQESISGELAGNELKAWLDRQGPSTAITLRRATRK